MTSSNDRFSFEISLSVLNHLGRQLYRSFATVLGEAISNAWDADARTVNIYLDQDGKGFWIKDDGIGMTAQDFRGKFLKVGYSKRKAGGTTSPKGRPYIGRKGIGKLALLSAADRISVLSKIKGADYVGGTIDNSALDKAITDDLQPQEYELEEADRSSFAHYTRNHKHGTIIHFDGMGSRAVQSVEALRYIIALYFRFALLDPDFRLFVNGKQVTNKDLSDLSKRTEFLWKLKGTRDSFVTSLKTAFKTGRGKHESKVVSLRGATGFVASVRMPRDLKVPKTGERVGVDLFVNGRLRERDILKRIPTARLVENYLYGQLHVNLLDDKRDRFTSSREGIVADDPKFARVLKDLRPLMLKIVEDWDVWRRMHREDGDSENTKISKAQRASEGLYNAVTAGFEKAGKRRGAKGVERWVGDLRDDAAFNFESYAECFVSENLIRKYITVRGIRLSPEARKEARKWKDTEKASKNRGNISIEIRRRSRDLDYLSMDHLANLVDKPKDPLKEAALARDANEFKPMRDAVAHTALLTDAAKKRLAAVRENIKGRLKTLLGGSAPSAKTPKP